MASKIGKLGEIRAGNRTPGGIGNAGHRRTARGFTLVQLIVVTVVIAIGFIVLAPIVARQREKERQTRCMTNAKEIGLAMQNYATVNANAFPPSAETYKKSATEYKVGGYSFLVKLLPYLEFSKGWSPLPGSPLDGDLDSLPPTDPTPQVLALPMHTPIPDFICPSNSNKTFQNPNASPPQFALTNYKAIGASTRDSLLMVSSPCGRPPYGTAAIHPDGAIFPSDHNLPMSSIADGTSHTILLIETMDDTNSRWMFGNECTLVGLPQTSSPTGAKPEANYAYFAPPGYDGKSGEDSAVARAGLRTFLSYDFSPGGADAGKYEDPAWAKAPPAYGPSSMHPGVLVVGYGDGSVQRFFKWADAASFLFLITKNGNDGLSNFSW